MDEAELQRKFYALSKKFHPDRFAVSDPRQAMYALRWTTLLNKAYQTLRDSHLRSLYLLELYRVPENKTTAVPVELAETYFELQELLEDGNKEPLTHFKKDLEKKAEDLQTEWSSLADHWPAAGGEEIVLKKLQALLNEQRYLKSMLADVERKLA
jgi:molecular chaperone HscB